MKKIVPVIAMVIISIAACHKEKKVLGCTDPNARNYNLLANTNDGTCQYCPIPRGTCEYEDTAVATQKILGKWYLRETTYSYPHSTNHYCYTGAPDYLEFLPNRTVNIHDSTGLEKTIVYEFGTDSAYGGFLYNKFRILDSISSDKEHISVCDSSLTIERWAGAFSLYRSNYVKE